jgi:hypothetical protein
MTATEILDALAHPRFERLTQTKSGWVIRYSVKINGNLGQAYLVNRTLDKLLDDFIEEMEGADAENSLS